jgi:hypothetical protein
MIFRSSQFATFKQCPRRAYYKYELGLRKKHDGKNIHLEFGKMLHEAIEAFHRNDAIEAGLEVINEWELPFDKVKNHHVGRSLLMQYARNNTIEVVSYEREFSFSIGNHTWKGRFDNIGIYNGKRFVGEYKTTNPRYLQAKPNDQFISYWAGAMIFYNDIAGIALTNLDPTKVQVSRSFINFSRSEFEEWINETKMVCAYFSRCKGKGDFPRHPQACQSFGRLCPYHELCSEPEVTRQAFIDRFYTVDEEAKNLSW